MVVADEINRTTPRTQAALLEAMAEDTVTIDGVATQVTLDQTNVKVDLRNGEVLKFN